MTTSTVELDTVETLVESWQEIAPTLQEVSRRTGLSRPEALLLYEGDEPWRVTA